jgi:hypothetical protein
LTKTRFVDTQVEDSGRWILQYPAGKMQERHRTVQENTGNPWNWKQYSGRKLSEFFPVDSCQLPVRSERNRSEIIGKISKNFRPEYCFHIPAISGVFQPKPTRTY